MPRWLCIFALFASAVPVCAQAPDSQKRLSDAFATIKDFDFWFHNDPWARAVFVLIDSGRDGVPVLCNELRDTESTRLQRAIPLALGEIGDRRAVPFLIHALARCRPDTGNNGFSTPDGELYWRMRRTLNPPVDASADHLSDDRPEQAMVEALEELTGHTELKLTFFEFGEDGEWPKEWGEATHERKRQVARRIADRWWTWWEANKKSLLTSDELAWVEANAPAHFQTPPTGTGRAISIIARSEDRIVTEYDVEVWADRERYTVKPDRDGVVKFNLPKDAERVTVVAKRQGCIPLVRFWDKEHKAPADYEIKFATAVQAGGVVNGADGKPLANASVFLVAPKSMGENRWADVMFHEVRTDEAGRWKTAQLPSSVKKLRVFVEHDRHQQLNKSTDVKPLLDGTFKVELKAVFDVSGVVADAHGKPIEGAKVSAAGEPYHAHAYLPVTTDAAGQFVIPRVAATKFQIAAQAKDGRVLLQQLVVDPKTGLGPLEIRLPAGRKIGGRVVDPAGRPIAGAIVQVAGPIGLFDVHTRSGADGTFEIAHAPANALRLEIFRSGYITEIADVPASTGVVDLKLKPTFHVRGSVTDARTGKPIDAFTYVQGQLASNGKQRFLHRNFQQHFTGGNYDRLFAAPHNPREREQEETQWYIRIEADGYAPQETRFFDESEGSQVFDFKLEPAESIAGTVVDASGKPVAGAHVLLATPSQSIEVYDGKLSKGGGPDRSLHVATDEQGRFTHRPQNESFELVAIHDCGYARMMSGELKWPMTLAPWGRIEGSVMRNGKPVPKAQMSLSVPGYWDDESGAPRVQLSTYVNCDDKGQFKLERVMAGRYRLSAQHTQQGAMGFSGPGFPLEIKSGQTLRLSFGGDAKRTVIGKLMFAKAQPPIDWSIAKLILSPHENDRKETTQPAQSIVVPLQKDGSFRIETVRGGAWQLMLDELKLAPYPSDTTKRVRTAKGGTAFELPDGEGGAPLDLGDVPIAVSREPLKPGMPAPPIDAITLDGKPFQLADYAGKYVLLDFWATWCGPCVRETPHLKAVRDATRDDPRFVMIGLSMDNSPTRPLAYTRSKHMDWMQGFIGMWGKHPAPEDFGVDGIPQIILIGPDGNVIATDLRGDAILKTVQDTLAKNP